MARWYSPLGVGPLPGIRHEVGQHVVPRRQGLFVQLAAPSAAAALALGRYSSRVQTPATHETPIDVRQIRVSDRQPGSAAMALTK